MRRIRWQCKAAGLAAGLFLWYGGWGNTVKAQDPLWMIGSSQIHFPQTSGIDVSTSALPHSFDPNIPDEYEYQGQIAERTQNIQYDDEGKVLFFVVDGNIYNRDGLLIADGAEDIDDRDCEVCFLGGTQVHIIPVPGSCTRYYVLGLFFNDFNRDAAAAAESAMLRWGVLDMALRSDLPVYADACAQVNGRFLNAAELTEGPWYGNAGASSWYNGWEVIIPQPFAQLVPAYYYLQQGVLYSGTAEGPSGPLHGACLQLEPGGRTAMVVRCDQGLVILDITATDIWKVSSPMSIDGYWPLRSTNLGYYVSDKDKSQRADMALHYNNGTLQVAWTSYNWFEIDPSERVDQTWVSRWKFGLSPGTPFTVDPLISPSTGPGWNPSFSILDQYDQASPAPLDYFGNPILRPAVPGVEFSPNGRYLYFIKSPNFALMPGGVVESNFGYIDLQWQVGDPGDRITLIPIGTGNESTRLVDSQLDINVGPDGTGTALYALSADVDQQWLSVFRDPDNPSAGTWEIEYLSLPDVASFTEDNSPSTQFRFLNRRLYRSTNLLAQQNSACCEDLTLTRDRSTVIDTECDLTWEPGDNAFWNEAGPIYIAADSVLRIASGAHVTAQDMEFRFGKDATLIIEPSASFTCTNCLFTNACDDSRWKGIEVQGIVNQHQFGNPHPTHQGKLVLRGSTVENAEIGVLVAKRGLFGNLAAGGVVLADRAWITEDDGAGGTNSFWQSTTFRNCRESVRFPSYQNYLPSGSNTYHNLSRFSDCVFTVDDQYPVAYDFQHHVYMHRVDGIYFRACTFENALPDAFFDEAGDFPGSLYLGHGIRSLDAQYTISSPCDVIVQQGSPCPEADTRFSEFRGLDHGIHALKGASFRNFHVDRVHFTNNIAGVYANGVVGYKVLNSKFSIGGRNVVLSNMEEQLWEQRHRGLFSTESYGMIVDDNELKLDDGAVPERLTEGIVIGYSRDYNDMVFRNTAVKLERGFIGEGVCSDQVNKPMIGLHFQCNTNQGNQTNIRSRLVPDFEAEPQEQTIRTNQGRISRVADNEFDQLATNMDFVNDGWQYNVIAYHWADPEVPFKPMYVSQGVAVTGTGTTGQPLVRPNNNCIDRRLPWIHLPDWSIKAQLRTTLASEKLNYGNNRYLYEQLIDGGNPDQVVQQIMDSWPQDAWDLRAYLLAKSPFLSSEILMDVVRKLGFPMAMKAEVCIANPDATQKDGFMKWLRYEAPEPMPESLLNMIEASWEQKTFRTALENTLADHHSEMTQAANLLIERYSADSTTFPVDSLLTVWQEIRTPAARYAEAMLLMEQGHYAAASAVVEGIPQEHPRLKSKQLTERDRMLSFIDFRQSLKANGRTMAELDAAEVEQLQTLIAGAYDRPATWMQNILCFLYDRCRTPMTGGDEEAPKARGLQHAVNSTSQASPFLKVFPNPTTTWAALDYDLTEEVDRVTLLVRDALGRPVEQMVLVGRKGKVILDTRPFAPGLYTIELSERGRILATEKLVVER